MTLKNTENTCIIEIGNVQTIDGERDEITERAEGKYYERGSKKYIIYKSEGVSSTIIVSDAGIAVKRTGSMRSEMVFNPVKKTSTVYFTPYGGIPMDIVTDSVICGLDGSGGTLRIRYTLIMRNEKYYNDMTIKVIGDKR